jgi:UDP-galactopyranose mutase
LESDKTVIVKEFSTSSGEPYYPVPSQRNRDLYARYQEAAKSETGVFFVGRLANYKYFNMDQAFKNALDLFSSIEG